MKRVLFVVLIVVACAIRTAMAGQHCTAMSIEPEVAQKAFSFALKTREALDNSGAQVALIARVGKDLSKYGLRYSHMGFVWRDHPQGRWLVVHELNQCSTTESDLFNEGLANFYLDDLFAWEALILIPSEPLQQKIVTNLREQRFVRLHHARYNMLAYPFSTTYQNSNQWALETLADAIKGPVMDRKEAQEWLKANGYVPTTVEIPALTRLGARMFRANIAFDDHPFDRRMAGQIDTVTVESVYKFLSTYDPSSKRVLVQLP